MTAKTRRSAKSGETTRRGPGRPRVLVDESARQRLIDVLSVGLSQRDAAAYVGVSTRAIQREAKRDPQFAAALEKAEVATKTRCLGLIQRAAATKWQAAAWLLERRWPREFGRVWRDVDAGQRPVGAVRVVFECGGGTLSAEEL